MGLTNVLNIAGSGLNVTQSSLDIVARNVANQHTPGYTKKTIGQEHVISGSQSFGARSTSITRAVDDFLQSQLRTETAALKDVEVRQQYLARLDQLFGDPGGPNALDSLYNEFAGALQELTSSPELFSSREAVVTTAGLLSQQLRQISGEVQGLRQLAEDSLAQGVSDINEALRQLATVNASLRIEASTGTASADLLDERDKFIDQIAEYLDIRVVDAPDGSVSIFTKSGNALLEEEPVTLVFDHRADIGANSVYSTNEAQRGVGTIKLVSSNGFQIDLIRNGVLNSGRIGALVQLRDDILVEAQSQLDELAHGLALSLSNKTTAGTAVTAGTQLGIDIDTAQMLPGNVISLNYTTTPPGSTQSVSIVRVDDAGALPLGNDATPDPNDIVIGVDFSSGLAAVATALNTALDAAGVLGNGITVSNPAGTTLRFLDDTGAGNTTAINSASITVTSTLLQDDGTQLALFTDGGNTPGAYSGSFDNGGQKLGFAGRIVVNSQIVQNNDLLVKYSTSPATPAGDTARVSDLLARLESPKTFSAATGIGQVQAPFTGTVGQFLERIVGVQTGRAEDAERELAAHEVVVSALSEKFTSSTSVDVNEELSSLIQLQNSFAANARIIQAVEELFDVLMRVF
ncbi:MAG: flagellar hook-associated protein FlgK [Methyloligellaceae bacterium]